MVRRRAELEDVPIHDLRHSFASRELALGESLTMIGKLLGHRQVQTTARCAHLARESAKTSAARVAQSIATKPHGPRDSGIKTDQKSVTRPQKVVSTWRTIAETCACFLIMSTGSLPTVLPLSSK